MRVIYWGLARRFYKVHKSAERPLRVWKRAVLDAEWSSYESVKQTFNSADWYEGLVIFDIKGNDFRLIAVCVFEQGSVYIKEILTHDDYDKGHWKLKHRRF